jgi:RNA-directed DNA polymerase
MAERRKLAAILCSDVVGYSRLAGASEDRILARLRALRSDLIDPTIAVHTPQGGPLSPILSNLVLDDLDKELARRGHRFCRYADDCNIYVRSHRAGERVMASVSRFLTNRLRLKVNEAKSAVARPEERKFLGFSISNDGSERRIAPKALDKFKGRIRDMTRRTRGFNLQQLIKGARNNNNPHEGPARHNRDAPESARPSTLVEGSSALGGN